MSKKFDFSAALAKDSQKALSKGVNKDLVLAPTSPAASVLHHNRRKPRQVEKPVFLSFTCPSSEPRRLDELISWLKAKGVKISRSKLIAAGAAQMTPTPETISYLEKYLHENPDSRKRQP